MAKYKGGKYCCVYGCFNNTYSNVNLSVFKIPKDFEKRQTWLRLINREDLTNASHSSSYVCEQHFDVRDINPHAHCKVLKKTAIPIHKLPMNVCPKEDVATQTDKTTKEEAATATNKTVIYKDNYSQTINWRVVQHQEVQTIKIYEPTKLVKNRGVQTLKKYAKEPNEPNKKRKLEPQAEADPLSIIDITEEQDEESEEAQKKMFHKLCDKFLSKKVAKLVKAQTDFM